MFNSVSYVGAEYLGGLPERSEAVSGTLTLNQRCIAIYSQVIVQWSDCNAVSVESEQVAKSKLGPALAFGILGAVTAKAKSQAVMTVRRNDGALAYFVIDKVTDYEVKAKIGPLLKSMGLSLVDEMSPEPPPGIRLASEIERLVASKDAGHIDDQEFKQMKAKLLE